MTTKTIQSINFSFEKLYTENGQPLAGEATCRYTLDVAGVGSQRESFPVEMTDELTAALNNSIDACKVSLSGDGVSVEDAVPDE